MKSFKIKSFISIAVAAMLMMVQGMGVCLAAENPLHSMPQKTVQANVAQYKPVTSQLTLVEPGFEKENINDGNANISTVIAMAENDYIQIDLLRRYRLKKIEVESRPNGVNDGLRDYIQVLGSDSEDFSQADVLGELGAASDVYTHEKMWEINLDGIEDYRYLKIVRTGAYGYGAFGELRAYAEFDVTEVSRNKTATANAWYQNEDWAAPHVVLDGKEAAADAWVIHDSGVHNWLQIGLGEPYHVGCIEMTARPGNTSNFTYQAFDFYGSNHAIESDEEKNYVSMPETTGVVTRLEEEKGYTGLTHTLTYDRYKNGENSADVPMTITKPFAENTDDSEAFRYVTYRHNYAPMDSLIGMIGIFSINPQVNKAEFSGNKISLSFSDKMNFENAENLITVKDSAGKQVSVSNVTGADYKLSFDVAVDNGEQYTVTLAKELANTYGTPLQKDFTYSFKTPPAIEVKDFYFTAAEDGSGEEKTSLSGLTSLGARAVMKNNTQNKTESAVIVIMLYDENGFLADAKTAKITDIGPGEEKPVATGLEALPENMSGYSAKALLWKDFTGMSSWTPMININ